ncbi:MAG: nitroreductase family protein [Candidatus Omnitrophica bacterium]|nr:nitroreductase family protein [Candidatus Omnitrophota bacterium]
MSLKNLVKKCRSYRRFYENFEIGEATLRDLVDLARLASSGGNLQPLKYILTWQPLENSLVFPALKWAAYLKKWQGPPFGERPSAYIVILGDTQISDKFEYDCGIAAQNIMLGACEKDLGGCMISSVDKDLLRKKLSIPQQYEILLVIALGKPKEHVVIEEVKGNDTKYFRDKNNMHYVPKRQLDDIILKR